MEQYRNTLRNKLNDPEQSHAELQARLESIKEEEKDELEKVIKDLEKKKGDLEKNPKKFKGQQNRRLPI